MNKNILLILLFFSFNIIAQNGYNEATLIFKDNKEVVGFSKVEGNRIKFKASLNEKHKTYRHKNVLSLKFKNGEKYVFKNTGSKTILVKELVTGKINLYCTKEKTVYVDTGLNNIPKVSSSDEILVYYFSKENKDYIKKYAPKNEKEDLKFYKSFFLDCDVFVNLTLEDRKKLNGMEGVVKYYNKNCN